MKVTLFKDIRTAFKDVRTAFKDTRHIQRTLREAKVGMANGMVYEEEKMLIGYKWSSFLEIFFKKLNELRLLK